MEEENVKWAVPGFSELLRWQDVPFKCEYIRWCKVWILCFKGIIELLHKLSKGAVMTLSIVA